MSANDGPSPEMRLFGSPGPGQPLTAADAERMLAGQGAAPGAPEDQQALVMMLGHAAGPARAHELADEAFAVATFALVKREKERGAESLPLGADGRGQAGAAGGRRWWRQTRRRPLVAVCASAAVLIVLSGTAAADALPAPMQRLAHDTFGAPAPRQPVPSVTTTPGTPPGQVPLATRDATSGKPTTSQSSHGNGKALGKDKGKAHGKAKGKAKGNAFWKANGKAKSAKATSHGAAKGHGAGHGHK